MMLIFNIMATLMLKDFEQTDRCICEFCNQILHYRFVNTSHSLASELNYSTAWLDSINSNNLKLMILAKKNYSNQKKEGLVMKSV